MLVLFSENVGEKLEAIQQSSNAFQNQKLIMKGLCYFPRLLYCRPINKSGPGAAFHGWYISGVDSKFCTATGTIPYGTPESVLRMPD